MEDEEMKAAGGGEKRDDGSMDVDSDDEDGESTCSSVFSHEIHERSLC